MLTKMVCYISLSSILIPPLIFASDLNVKLEGDIYETRSPHAPIIISLLTESQSPKVENTSNLTLEIDNIDVSEFVTIKENQLNYKPVTLLNNGEHEIRVVQTIGDEIIELGSWLVQIRADGFFQSAEYSSDAQLSVSNRFKDHNLASPEPSHTVGQGNAINSFNVTTGKWYAKGQFDLYYNTLNKDIDGERVWDNDEFQFKMGNNSINTIIGHQELNQVSLITDSFRRKGISVNADTGLFNNSQLSGFMLSSQELRGTREKLGLSDSDQKITGFELINNPITNSPEALKLTATWYQGHEASEENFFDSETEYFNEGQAWSLAADSLFFSSHLNIHGEYSDAEYKDITDKHTDSAYDVLMQYNNQFENNITWNIGSEVKKVGTFYRSIMNTNLPSDRKLYRLFGGLQWDTINLDIESLQMTDNVNKLADLAQIKTSLHSLNMSWSPSSYEMGLFGIPSLNGNISRQIQDQIKTPSVSLFEKVNNKIDNYIFDANFSYAQWSWYVNFGENRLRDSAEFQHDTNTHSYGIGVNWYPSEQLSFAGSFQQDVTRDLVDKVSSRGVNTNLAANFVIIPEKWRGSINYSLNHNSARFDSIDDTSQSVDFSLAYIAIPARRNRPGLDIELTGQWNDFDDFEVINSSFNNYQFFITFSVTLPARFGGAQ